MFKSVLYESVHISRNWLFLIEGIGIILLITIAGLFLFYQFHLKKHVFTPPVVSKTTETKNIESLRLSFSSSIVDLGDGKVAIILERMEERKNNFSMDLSHSPLWQLELWDKKTNSLRVLPDFSTIQKYGGRIPANKNQVSITTKNGNLILSWHDLPIQGSNMKANVTIRISLKGE